MFTKVVETTYVIEESPSRVQLAIDGNGTYSIVSAGLYAPEETKVEFGNAEAHALFFALGDALNFDFSKPAK